MPFYATLGNDDDANERFYPPFHMDGARYYTYTKGPVHFFALDSTHMDATQIVWLEARLREAGNADWKVCYFHHPLYSSARHHGPDVALRKQIQACLSNTGVDVVLSGHDHVYQRLRPQQGIVYFVEGSSGKLRAGNLKPSPMTAKGFDADRSFMLIEFASDDMYFEAVSRLGVVVGLGRHSSHDWALLWPSRLPRCPPLPPASADACPLRPPADRFPRPAGSSKMTAAERSTSDPRSCVSSPTAGGSSRRGTVCRCEHCFRRCPRTVRAENPHMDTQTKDSRDYRMAIGFALGPAVGAGLMMWLAPRAASELRQRVTDSARTWASGPPKGTGRPAPGSARR